MNQDDFKKRTKRFALDVTHFCQKLPRTREIDIFARQLLRSGTSVGANYRSACRARSRADFVSKMGVVEEEADESVYWLELLQDAGFVKAEQVLVLIKEGNELLAMTVASINTARPRKS
jgi:four helix bundle protein